MAEIVQLFNDLTSSTPSSELTQNLQTMYDNNLTFDEQVEIFCQLVRETQEKTIFTTDEGNRVKGRLIDAMIDNFIIPMCEKIRQGMSQIPEPLSTNPDDYIWTFYTITGFGIFDGGYQDCYGYRGELYAQAKMKTSIPSFEYDTTNGIPRALASVTNSLVYVSTGEIHIRSDVVDPFSYKYFDHYNLSPPTKVVAKYFYNTGTQTTPFLFSQIINWALTPSAFDIVRENPNGSDTSTSGKYPSTEMGGLGTFDDSTDLSDISTKPTLDLSNLGFFSVWNPTSTQLRQLADYVWNDPANVAAWPQIFRDGIIKPMDYIISLALYPFSSSLYTKALSQVFCMGGIPFNGGVTALGMTINMDKITEQFIDINMGTVDLKEYFGSFLDYAPYSQVSLYLPYYGTVQLSMNEIQNADSITILYRVNILDGSTAIKVHIDRQTSAAQNGSVPLKHVLYEYFTNLKTEIPRTSGASVEQMKMLATVLSATVTAAAPIAGAGVSHLAGGVQGAMAGGGMTGFMAGAQQGIAGVGQAVENGLKIGASAGNKLVNSMPSGGGIQRGNIGGMNNGLLSERRPFLIITRPIQVLPANYQDMEGYTTSVFTTLSTLESGFVQCESVDSSGLDVTASEKEEIVKLLQGGVYI